VVVHGRRHKDGEAAERVLDNAVPVGDLAAQDSFTSLAVDREVVRVLPKVWRGLRRQGERLASTGGSQQGERRPEQKGSAGGRVLQDGVFGAPDMNLPRADPGYSESSSS
jgi:hypothetical protein